jgi:hypothetical protein
VDQRIKPPRAADLIQQRKLQEFLLVRTLLQRAHHHPKHRRRSGESSTGVDRFGDG